MSTAKSDEFTHLQLTAIIYIGDFMKDYREIVKNKRVKLGISQTKLSKLIGITQQHMSEIESGRKSPSIEVLQRICDTLSIEMFCDKE